MHPTGFPAFCTQPHAYLVTLSTEQGTFIVYERERDFLSAPRAFIVVQLEANANVVIGASYADEEQWQALEQQANGVYCYVTPNGARFIFYGQDQTIDVQTDNLNLAAEIYGCHTPLEALQKHLTAIDMI